MFNPLYLLTLLPSWMVGMYLLRLLRRREEEAAERRVRATVPVSSER